MKAQVSFKHGCAEVKVDLPVFSFKEGEVHAIYTPVLDLFGYGKSEEEAKESFRITLGEFLHYATTNDTLEKELKRLGWKISNKTYKVPDLHKLLRDNEQFKELFNRKEFSKFKFL